MIGGLPLELLSEVIHQDAVVFKALSGTSKAMKKATWQLIEKEPMLFKRWSNWILTTVNEESAKYALTVVPQFENTHSLDISLSKNVQQQRYELFVKKFSNINTVSFSLKDKVPDVSAKINAVIKSCPLLKTVSFYPCGLSLQTFEEIVLPESLEDLDITNNWVNIFHLKKDCPALKVLRQRCYGNSPSSPDPIETSPKGLLPKTIQSLHIDHRLAKEALSSSSKEGGPKLAELAIYSPDTIKGFEVSPLPESIKKMIIQVPVTDSFFASICRECRVLEELELSCCKQLSMNALLGNPLPATLTLLSFSQLKGMKASVLNTLFQSLPALTEVHFEACRFQEGSFEDVKWPSTLSKLAFIFTEISPKELEKLSNAGITYSIDDIEKLDKEIRKLKISSSPKDAIA